MANEVDMQTTNGTAQSQYDVDVAIIGAGPAGLTAGYLLSRQGYKVAIIEKDPHYVGGISRTVEHEGYRFDIGGHRFFSKSQQVIAGITKCRLKCFWKVAD